MPAAPNSMSMQRFSSAGVPLAPRFFLNLQRSRPFLRQDEQDAGATSAHRLNGPAKF